MPSPNQKNFQLLKVIFQVLLNLFPVEMWIAVLVKQTLFGGEYRNRFRSPRLSRLPSQFPAQISGTFKCVSRMLWNLIDPSSIPHTYRPTRVEAPIIESQTSFLIDQEVWAIVSDP